jgi:hypothetical protein
MMSVVLSFVSRNPPSAPLDSKTPSSSAGDATQRSSIATYVQQNRISNVDPHEMDSMATYMQQHDIKDADPNQLYAMATNRSPDGHGSVPKGVQETAEAMLAGSAPDAPSTHSKAPLSQQAKEFAGTMNDFMRNPDNNTPTVDPNKLHSLATDPNASPHVRQAAAFFLQHSKIFKDAETGDVKKSDGLTNASNFAAMHAGTLGKSQQHANAAQPQAQPQSTDQLMASYQTMAVQADAQQAAAQKAIQADLTAQMAQIQAQVAPPAEPTPAEAKENARNAEIERERRIADPMGIVPAVDNAVSATGTFLRGLMHPNAKPATTDVANNAANQS